MKQFSFIDHTADIRMLVKASTYEELMASALEGMNSILFESELNEVKICDELSVHVNAVDATALLIDFLSEVLSHSQINTTLYSLKRIIQLNNTQIQAELSCKKLEYFSEDIKAVTYHEAEVKTNTEGLLETLIVFDI